MKIQGELGNVKGVVRIRKVVRMRDVHRGKEETPRNGYAHRMRGLRGAL